MHLLSKALLAAALTMAANIGFSQEEDEFAAHKAALQNDDTAALAKLVTPKNINDCVFDWYTLLSQTIRFKATKCFNWMLENGADVNARCEKAKPPIYLACKYGDLDMFKKLEAKGADLSAHYGNGLLPYAKDYNPAIFEYLQKKNK